MSNLSQETIASAKAHGFLLNRGTNCFSGRVVVAGGVCTTAQLARIAECARLYGNGNIGLTARLCVEIAGIPFDKLDEAAEYLSGADSGLFFGGTGKKIRPIPACKGTTCVYGCCDTQELARQLHQRYYIEKGQITLPHKFKIAVGGCPNSCIKPSLNDFGIEACRGETGALFQIYVGGTWGKHTRVGTPLSKLVTQEALFPALDKVIFWFMDNAQPGERLGTAIDRLGIDELERLLFE